MHKTFSAILLALIASVGYAEDCPDFYRFVDFGVEGHDGVVRRGGTIFRAFDADNTHMLFEDRTICRTVDERSKDGRGLFIPVVDHIEIRPQIARLDVLELRMTAVSDVTLAAEANAAAHRDLLQNAEAVVVRTEDFVCVRDGQSNAASCQFRSPFGDNVPLVIYCDDARCDMPVSGRGERVVLSGAWKRNAEDLDELGREILLKIQDIHAFLAPHS